MTIVFLPPSSGGAASVADATDSVAGKIRISTTSESNTGTNDTTAMTPLKVQQRIAAALTGGVEYKGAYTGQSLVTAQKGDLYVSSGSQTLAGVALANNDHIIFSEDAADPVTTSMFDVIDNTESDTLNTVTGRGATTSNSVQVGGLNIAGNYAFPTADGGAGQILKTDGSGALTFQALGSMSSQAANSVNISGGSIAGITDLAVADGGTGAGDASGARTNLGLVIGTDVAPINAPAFTGNATAVTQSQSDGSTKIATTAYVDTAVSSASESDTLNTVTGRGATTSNSVQVGGLNIAGNYALPTADGSAGQILKTDGSGALTFQALGSMSSQAANSVNISGGSITGITDLAIADGGTGAGDAATALSNLGGIGSVLADTSPELGGHLDVSTYDIKTTSGNATIGLEAHGTGFTELRGNTTGGNNPGAIRFNCEQNSHGVILKSPLHADYDAANDYTLTLPTGLPASDKVLQSTSAGVLSWVAQSGASSDTLDTVTGRGATTSNSVQVGGLNIAGNYALPTADGGAGQILKTDGSGALTFQSLGSISSQAANNVNISGGSITGITDLAVADGGTGAGDASGARTNLGLVIGTDVAPIAAPAFTGNATAVTQSQSDGSTKIATTAYVDTAVSGGGGGGGYTYSAKTGSFTAAADYHYSCTNAITATLPAASSNANKAIRIKVMGSDTVTIGRNGSDTIDGVASDYSMTIQYSSITLFSTGSNNGWEII